MEQFLSQIRPFQVLSKKELSHVSQQTRERVFEKGEIVFREGEKSSFVWLVKTGWVHLVRRSSLGHPVILFTMTPREILCGVSAFDQEPYAADAIAATQCVLLQIPTPLFVHLLNHHSDFCREILSICSKRIRCMAQKLGGAMDPVSHRMARLLLASLEDFGDEIPFTHREMAQMIGARIETSIRTFRPLREKSLINIKRSCIKVVQPFRLISELNQWLKVDK
ncbi:MAG: Crp/Fnr family transcriptional regulator [Chlamydiae bacterium]|nr:Crp/Fnr family transcriptional regulator [Chlamydiota bacterium]MBI3276978.1 Crp/Fnr family transcriptional regulator [Chlamydiota bacterium]